MSKVRKSISDQEKELLDQKEIMASAEPGKLVELTQDEADALGAFRETALTLEDVIDSEDG